MKMNRTAIARMLFTTSNEIAPNLNLAQQIQMQQRAIGLGWRYDGLADWSTDSIFEKLRELGVQTSRETFRSQATEAGRCEALGDAWMSGLPFSDLWVDFPLVASEELWMRLTPDQLCPETLSRALDDALQVAYQRDHYFSVESDGALYRALGLMLDYLEAVPIEERAARYDALSECSLYNYSECVTDLIYNSGSRHLKAILRLVNVMSELFPEDAQTYWGDLPFAFIKAGHIEDALQRVEENLRRYPNDLWIRIYAGDCYEDCRQEERTLELFISAFSLATDPEDWDDLKERIQSTLARLGRSDTWRSVEKAHPRPEPHLQSRLLGRGMGGGRTHKEETAPATVHVGPKIGVNDPCPCGSGKKYKKCCKDRPK